METLKVKNILNGCSCLRGDCNYVILYVMYFDVVKIQVAFLKSNFHDKSWSHRVNMQYLIEI